MKIRQALAGLAAAATMIGGLAIGAGSAQAVEADPAPAAEVTSGGITVNNSQAGHTYTAYRFATLNPQLDADGNLSDVEIKVADGPYGAVQLGGYRQTVRDAVTEANGGTLPEQYADTDNWNAAAAVAGFDQAKLRAFADAFTKAVQNDKNISSTASVEGNGSSVQIDVTQGWYLVTDTVDGAAAEAGTSAIVATPLLINGTTYTTLPVTSSDPTQAGIDATGVFNSKHQVALEAPTTTSNSDTRGTVAVGNTVTYTTLEKLDGSVTDLYVKIVTSKGLKAPTSFVAFSDVDGNGRPSGSDPRPAYTVVSQTGDAANGTVTVLKVTGLQDVTSLGVQYNATVTPDVENHAFSVTASVGLDNATWVEGNTDTLRTADVAFQKVGVDADANGLNGAQFMLRYANDSDCTIVGSFGAKLCYFQYGSTNGSDGWSVVAKSKGTTFTSAAVDGKNGVVQLNGLGAGTYTVEEVTPAAGYSTQFLPKFNVTIAADGTVSVESTADSFGLVTANADASGVTVKNVKAITQLPLTGSVGAAALSGVGVLALTGLAVLGIKSRKEENLQ